MVNPPAPRKKTGNSAQPSAKGNNTNARSATSTSKSKHAASDENTEGVLAKRQNTGTNGRARRDAQVFSAASSNNAPVEADGTLDGDEILQKYNEMKGYLYA